MTLTLLSSVWIILNWKPLWIGLCLGIPFCVALFMKDEWDDASIRRSTDKSDEKEDDGDS